MATADYRILTNWRIAGDLREAVDIHETPVGDLEVRNDGQGQERDLQEGLGEDDIEASRRVAQGYEGSPDGFERHQAHQAGHRQRDLGQHAASLDHHEAALDLSEPVHRHGHVGIVRPDHRDVVAVVPDRRGDGPAPEAESFDERDADAAPARCRAAVALEQAGFDHGSFDAVSLFDVLEHLIDPGRTLRASIDLLAPGGILFLYVPNFDSASRLLMATAIVNPVGAVRTGVMLALDGTAAFGAASLAFLRFTGGSTGAYLWLIASVMAWTFVGYFVGAKRLEKADL